MIALWLLCQLAAAHEPGLSYADIRADEIAVIVDVDEFADRFPTDDIDAASLLLAQNTIGATSITANGERCLIGTETVERFEEDGVRISAALRCPGSEGWQYHASWVRGREAGHRHVVSAFGQPVGMLDPSDTTIALEPAPGAPLTVAAGFLKLGVGHILSGIDHIAFLFALMLVFRSWGQAAMVVTGFTVAHSITLTLAALDLVRLSPSLVEPAIALTVAFVGIENLWDPPVTRRAVLTLGLGLIHGFGFAGALGEIGIPRDHAPLALLCFNLGVEIGQLALIAAALPLLLRLRRVDGWERHGIRMGSIAIAVMGVLWFASRVT